MKISRIQVDRFQKIRDLDFTVPPEPSLMCLTGANGSGKSSLFKLISMAVGAIGLGGDSQDWAGVPHGGKFSVIFDFSDESAEFWDKRGEDSWAKGFSGEDLIAGWDRTISVELSAEPSPNEGLAVGRSIVVDGFDWDTTMNCLVSSLSNRFDTFGSLKHLHLQSDRAFDDDYQNYRGQLSPDQLREIGILIGMRFSSSKPSRDLYAEWIESTVYIETNRLLAARSRARATGSSSLVGYEDPLASINEIVHQILPHISVRGVDLDSKKLIIGSGDIEIDFQGLSGGEREVLFLCGQINRLRLTKGILLIDEPELHLNPDLLRRFLTVIQQTAGEGQLWLATHSYEAIEAAGASSTFVVDSRTGEKTTLRSLRDQPVVETLASVLGRAGFGLSNTTFVIVEGGRESIRERQRFAELVGHPQDVVFADIGEGKRDVKRMLDGLLTIAQASGEQLQVKAIVDADFGSLESTSNEEPRLFQLSVHEIENLFLHPASLTVAVSNITSKDEPWDFEALIRKRFAAMAGRWIWHRIQYRRNDEWKRQQGKLDAARQCAKLLLQQSWDDIESKKMDVIQALKTIDESMASDVRNEIGAFPGVLNSSELWKHCFGKETLKSVADKVGYSDHDLLERAVISAWDECRAQRPQELIGLRAFLGVTD